MVTKEQYIQQLEREGWEVSDTTLNVDDFTQIVTTTTAVANTKTAVITIQPPSGSQVRILKGGKVWLYAGGAASEINDFQSVNITRERADGDENKLDSGIYEEFKKRDEETVHRFKRNVLVLPSSKLKINVTPDVATTTQGTKFALDCLILQQKEGYTYGA